MQNVIASSKGKSLIDNCIIHKASTFFATQDIQYCIPLFYKKVISKPRIHKAILKSVMDILRFKETHTYTTMCLHTHNYVTHTDTYM